MTGTIPLIHGSDGKLNDALAAAAGIPCSLQDVPGALGTPQYEPPQPEGTPAMQGSEPEPRRMQSDGADQTCKDQGTLPALISELEELNSELQCELQCLDGAVDRLGAHSHPQDCTENNKIEPAPETHLARLHHQIIRLRNLRDETRELNRRLAEAV